MPGEAEAAWLHAMSVLETSVIGLLLRGKRTFEPASSVEPSQNSCQVAWADTEVAAKSDASTVDANFIVLGR